MAKEMALRARDGIGGWGGATTASTPERINNYIPSQGSVGHFPEEGNSEGDIGLKEAHLANDLL